MGILSPLTGILTPMGYGAISSGGGIDSYCLALIRPMYSGGTWAPGDASPSARAVTNSGLTIGAEGTGPWGETSRAIVDPDAAGQCYTAATSDFAASSLKDIDVFIKITSLPVTYSKWIVWVGPAATTNSTVGIGFTPINAAAGKIRYFVISRTGTGGEYVKQSIDFTWDAGFRHVRAAVMSDGVRLWVGGAYQGATATHTPTTSTSARLVVGASQINAVNNGYGYYAECRLSSVYRWSTSTDFTPPTGPYY